MDERRKILLQLSRRLQTLSKSLYQELLLLLNARAGGFDGDEEPYKSAPALIQWAESKEQLHDLQETLDYVLSGPKAPSPKPDAPSPPKAEPPSPSKPVAESIGPWVRIDAAFLDAHRTQASERQLLHYFDGREPNWAIAQDPRIPTLALGTTILGTVQSKTGELTFDLFIGATGEGKTTLLYQLAAKLGRNENTAVYWLPRSEPRFDPDHAYKLPRGRARTVLVMDHADLHLESLLALVKPLGEKIGGTSDSFHLIAAARADRWRACAGPRYGFQNECHFHQYDHIRFDIDGAKTIMDAWTELGEVGLGRLAEVPVEQRARALLDSILEARSRSGASFFGALLDIRYQPEQMLDHLRRLCGDLIRQSTPLVTLYIAIALVDALTGAGVDERVLADALNLERAVVSAELPKLEEEAAIVSAVGGPWRLLQTRHHAIAQGVARIAQDGYLNAPLESLVGALVASTVRLGRRGEFILSYGDLAHASTRMDHRLRGVVTVELARRMAVFAAQGAWDAEPRPDFLSELVNALRRSRAPEQAIKVAAEAWPQVTSLDDEHRFLRHLLQAWAHAHVDRGDAELAMWLNLHSLSDQVVNPKTGRRILLSQLDLRKGLVYAIKNGLDLEYAQVELIPLEPLLGLEVELPTVENPRPRERWKPDDAPCAPAEVIDIFSRLEQRVSRKRLPPALADLEPLTFEAFERAYQRQVHALYGGLLRFLPSTDNPHDLVCCMELYCREERGFEPTAEQHAAFQEIAEGHNVLLNTPTGSGKSIVGLFAHARAFARGKRGVYTAPTKALVNEKFFELCRLFGARNVGIVTGDVTANRDAAVICCTAEILANKALALGRGSDFAAVVMDEFHYYGDPARGRAWLIPLVTMQHTQFVLMSATVGEPEDRRRILEEQTGGHTALVRSVTRPVTLRYEYKRQLLFESIQELRERKLCPAYVVSFKKHEATEQAEDILRMVLAAPGDKAARKERRQEIETILAGERLDTPFGKKLRRLLVEGIGVHHAGMLPRYRRLVERLAVEGKLDFISGTDTLGVGINMPILTVLFTRLWKFAGDEFRELTPQEFQQLSGRAGRPGMKDEFGMVWVQHPEHLTETERAKKKKKGKLAQEVKPPKDYVPWDESHMQRLSTQTPEPMQPQFDINGDLVLNALRDPHGEQKLRQLVQRIGLPKPGEEKLLAKLTEIIERLAQGGHITRSRDPVSGALTWNAHDDDATGPCLRAEARFLSMALGKLDQRSPTFALQVLSLIEATLEDPTAVVRCQKNAEVRKLEETLRALRHDPQREEERQALEAQISNLKDTPLPSWAPANAEAERVRALWDQWQKRNPDLVEGEVRPRSVARAMYEGGSQFSDYVRELDKLDNDEGVLLKHLSQTYRALQRELPPWPYLQHDEQLLLIKDWLQGIVRDTDPSLVDEWERIERTDQETAERAEAAETTDPTTAKAFHVRVRNEAFSWVKALARRDYEALGRCSKLSDEALAQRMKAYWQRYPAIRVDADARGPDAFEYDPATGRVRQTLLDPEGDRAWDITGSVDLARSREERRAVVLLEDIGPHSAT